MVKITIDIPNTSTYTLEGEFVLALVDQGHGVSLNICNQENSWSVEDIDPFMGVLMLTYLEKLGPLGVIHLGHLLSQVVDRQIKEEEEKDVQSNWNFN